MKTICIWIGYFFLGVFLKRSTAWWRLSFFLNLYHFWVAVSVAHSGNIEGKMKTSKDSLSGNFESQGPQIDLLLVSQSPVLVFIICSGPLFGRRNTRQMLWAQTFLPHLVQKWKPKFPFTGTATCWAKGTFFFFF